jgi:ribosome maturation factor RimP
MLQPKQISPELFNTVRKDVARYIKKKLKSMEIEVTDMELHNSSLTKTIRVYATLGRTTNLKALYLAEQMVTKELQHEFRLQVHAFYWRYLPEERAAEELSGPPSLAN